MNLKHHKFPEVDIVSMAFPTLGTDKELLKEAMKRGFYNERTPYNELFSKLFFDGGRIKFKQDVDEEFRNKVWKYCRSFMRSWAPKHEEKEAICAMLMSEILEPELDLT